MNNDRIHGFMVYFLFEGHQVGRSFVNHKAAHNFAVNMDKKAQASVGRIWLSGHALEVARSNGVAAESF